MKPPAFGYVAPRTVDDAVAALDAAAGTAMVLAGGQSLLQDLRWRRVHPSLLVDIGGVDELAGIAVGDTEVRIGARVRHRDLEDPTEVPGPLGALLARAAAYVAHPPVRSRGTVVGSLAWAHPASEWCAVAAGLGGRVELASVGGRRELPVSEFLVGPGRTACGPGELVTALVLPRLPGTTRVGFTEQRRTHASFAQVAVAVAVDPAAGAASGPDCADADGDGPDGGAPRRVHIGLAGAARTAVRATAAEAVLRAAPTDLAGAAAAAARDDADPVAEPHTGAAYRRHLVAVLLRRTLEGVS